MARITRLLAAAAAVATMLGVATGANAAIVAVSNTTTYGADVTANPVVTCEMPTCTGTFTLTPSGGAFFQTGPGVGAVPPGDPTAFMTVVGGGAATLSAGIGNVITGLSFFMGSPDAFNSVSFFSGASLIQTLTGAQFNGAPPNGDQSVGQRVTFSGLGSNVTSVVFNSTSTAFEFDRVIAGSAPVPEPATWGMMILGMGMVGLGLRMRRRTAAALT